MTGDASSVRTALTRGGRTFRPAQSSPPIRQVLADRRELVATARERAQSPFQTLRHYSGTTPGKLIIICVILFLGCLSTGLYASTVLEDRTQTLQRLIDRTEPLAEPLRSCTALCRSPTRPRTRHSSRAVWKLRICGNATQTPWRRPRRR